MTRWPLCLAEVALYAVFAGLVLWMALDARDRWKQLRERRDSDTARDNAPAQDDRPDVSALSQKPEGERDHLDPPPLAS